ncbi:MAG TPA: nucleotidyltransferase family protein [Gaiellaceae bacterium]|nr:nucleotidyltransferase family protein [Gaiellaceae bacterium]
MKALILAAGYATRLRPLTDTWAKELLPVGGRPIIEWIVDAVREVAQIDEVHVVTNAVKAPMFVEWAAANAVRLHDDGTTSNETRLGAIGDLAFVLREAAIDDDLLVIAGDNLFDFSLRDYVAYWREKGVASAVAVRDVGSLELATQYGIVTLEADSRITDFIEKPSEPPSTLAATATYLYHREHLPLVDVYLAEGHSHDQPGRLIGWLRERAPVYAWQFDEPWYDIGNLEQLLVADNHLRGAHGLPLRTEYSPSA